MPDDVTKAHIARSKRSQLEGAFRLCLDTLGRVESILPMRSTGFAAYDRKLIAGMHGWLYSPFRVDGVPHPVCTSITFIYLQRTKRRPR